MAFKPTYVRRKSCLPLYILCIEVLLTETKTLNTHFRKCLSHDKKPISLETHLVQPMTVILKQKAFIIVNFTSGFNGYSIATVDDYISLDFIVHDL